MEGLNRDKELNAVFDENAKPKMRAGDREKARKRKWLAEMIKIVRMNSEGEIPLGCEWRVIRRKVTRKFIQELINRCPLPCTIDYVYDNHGVAIWMDDLMAVAQVEPAFYVIAPEVIRLPVDIMDDPTYDGQTCFFLKYVPLKAKDDYSVVDAEVIKEYILYAISEVDRVAQRIRADIKKIEKDIVEIEKTIKRIPKQEIRDVSGNIMTGDAADEQREMIYKMYGEAKYKIECKLNTRKQDLVDHTQWRRMMGMELIQAEIDQNTETAVWEIHLYGTSDAHELEDMLVAKDDWAGIKLAVGSTNPPLPPWAGRGVVPDGSKPYLPDYSQLQVNISGARVMRLPHGIGTSKHLDSTHASIASDRFGLYYGDWVLGKRSGYGIEINDSEVYAGRFVDGFRNGYGRIDLANGTMILGHVGLAPQNPQVTPTYGFDNPYLDGESNGPVEILFSGNKFINAQCDFMVDGAIYKGNMVNGRINGYGEYESAFGEKIKGTFVDGVLHGPTGSITTHAEEKYEGRWVRGELCGRGTYENSLGDKYSGHWEHSMRHGRGYDTIASLGYYKGFFVNGTRTGKGELDFTKRKQEDVVALRQKNKDARPIPEFKTRYQGYFAADNITNGGIMFDTMVQTPYCVAKRDKSRTTVIEKFIKKHLQRLMRLQRKNEKFDDLQKHIRMEMAVKKYRIFKQQRHYLKKTMYYEDDYGLEEHMLGTRDRARANKFNKIDPLVTKSTRALVPRLQLKDEKSLPTSHLQDAFNRIEHSLQESQSYAHVDHHTKDRHEVDNLLVRIAVNDMEEAVERQNMLKYDRIWERAEKSYTEMKKKAALAQNAQSQVP